MKKILLLLSLSFILFSCESDEISDLEKRVDELELRLDELDLDGLVNEFAELKQKVEELEIDLGEIRDTLGDISEQIDEINKQLEAIREELENADPSDGSYIYWGDVSTDAQFAEIKSGNYTKITGQVNVTSDYQMSNLDSVDFIGGNFVISGVTSVLLENLEIVSGSILLRDITDGTATIEFPMLNSVGQDFTTEASSVNKLSSLSLPSLVIVGGNFVLAFESDNIFESFTSSLSVVSGHFQISNSSLLPSYDSQLTYVGGDFSLHSNMSLSLLVSPFELLSHIGGSLSIRDNYDSSYGGSSNDFTSSTENPMLFDNLVYLGENLYFLGSADITTLSGFSSLELIPGELQLTILQDETDNLFNGLLSIEGDFYFGGNDIVILDGFEYITNVGGSFTIDAKEAYGFENLQTATSRYSDQFTVRGEKLPQFSSLKYLNGGEYLSLSFAGANYVDFMPSFTMRRSEGSTYVTSIHLDVEFRSSGDISFSGLESLTKLTSLSVNMSDDTNLSFDALTTLSSVGYYDFDESAVNLKVLDLDQDYSALQSYFQAKGDEYISAQTTYNEQYAQYVIDSTDYAADPESFEYPPYAPRYSESTTESIHFTLDAYWDDVNNIYVDAVNYAEQKINEDSEIPALIQAFIHFGNMDDSDFDL